MTEPSLAPGTKLGKYQLVRLIGEGGMGSVYEALHGELEKRVAIKMLLPSIAANEAARARFLREGRASSRIRHPHVVDVTDVESHEGLSFLVMEYLEGETLADLFAREGALSLERLLDLMLPVLSAVAAGHDAGVIHRDLKPHNIFLARGRRGEVVPKVLDFGISKVLSADGSTGTGRAVTATGVSFGTVAYMSPEQAGGAKNADARSDQYSLGLILYEGATGRRAHEADNVFALLRQIADGSVPSPRTLRPDLPPVFEQALLRALAIRPEGRYESIYQLGQALLPFASARGRVMLGDAFVDSHAHPPRAEEAPRPPATERLVPSTTLRSAASALADESAPERHRRGPLFLVVGLAALIAVAGALALHQYGGRSSSPRAAGPSVVPPTASIPPPPVAPAPEPTPPPTPVAPAPPPVAVAPEPAPAPRPKRPQRTVAKPKAAEAAKERQPSKDSTPKTGSNNAIILP
jgi:serine/threonine-protein kinase